MSCGVGRRHGSDPELLWLWCRPAATAPIRPLAWEPPHATSAALKRHTHTHTKKKKIFSLISWRCSLWFSSRSFLAWLLDLYPPVVDVSMWCEVGVNAHILSYRWLLSLASLIGKVMLFVHPAVCLNYKSVTIYIWVYFRILCSLLPVYLSVLGLVSHWITVALS